MSTDRTTNFRFANLRLFNWRNFENVDIDLQNRVFLIGPNASGKSNFLDAIRFFHDLVAFGGGFREAVARRDGVSKLRCHAARRYSDIEVAAKVQDSNGNTMWSYELRFNQDNQSRPIIKKEIIYIGEDEFWSRPDKEDEEDEERLRQTALEQVNFNKEFRGLANFFDSVRYSHLVPQLVREPERYQKDVASSRFQTLADPFGSDFLEVVSRVPRKTRDSWLRRVGDALRLVVPQLKELEFHKDQVTGMPHLRARFEHWRPYGAWHTEEQFSDGTLRLIGLLWSILQPGGPLLLEEPELSLHPDVVRYLPQMFARMQQRTGRQVILSSHSSDILRDEGIGLDEVLLLRPGAEGTSVESGKDLEQADMLLRGGIPLSDIVLPETRPPKPEKLSFFGR